MCLRTCIRKYCTFHFTETHWRITVEVYSSWTDITYTGLRMLPERSRSLNVKVISKVSSSNDKISYNLNLWWTSLSLNRSNYLGMICFQYLIWVTADLTLILIAIDALWYIDKVFKILGHPTHKIRICFHMWVSWIASGCKSSRTVWYQ